MTFAAPTEAGVSGTVEVAAPQDYCDSLRSCYHTLDFV
jgi:hypothetical protein